MRLSYRLLLFCMKRIYGTLGFLIAILIFSLVLYYVFRDLDPLVLMGQVGVKGLLANLFLGAAYFASIGLLIQKVYTQHYGQSLSKPDTFLLPFMMHLWTYILPIKGGLIFQTYFLKSKYGLDLSKGFSVGVLIFAVSLLVTCLAGGVLTLMMDDVQSVQLLLLSMFGSLALLLAIGLFSPKTTSDKPGFIHSIIRFGQNVLSQFLGQAKDPKLVLSAIFLTLFNAAIYAAWFYHSALILGFNPSPMGIALVSLVLRIVILIRVLPGNLGVQELIIGTVFLAANLGLKEGLTTALLIRLNSVILAVIFGGYGTYQNLGSLGLNSIKQLYQRLKGQ
jgi:uncharacterized membrane protein YbhN (UPF0104 family)